MVKKYKRKGKNALKKWLIVIVIITLGYFFISNNTINWNWIRGGFGHEFKKGRLDLIMDNIQTRLASLNMSLTSPFATNLTIEEKIKIATDPQKDSDRDGIPDTDEIEGTLGFVTDPNNPDTDGDGLSDLREYWWLTDPTKKDTNGDFISDGESVNQRKAYPYVIGGTISTLGNQDLDGDGLPTAAEIYELGTDYKAFSTDGDRYGDGQELFGINTKHESLPLYVEPDMFVPAVPDIGVRVHPKIKLNLAETVKIGNMKINKGEHEFKTERESTQTTTFSTGAKMTEKISVGWPPWDVSAETEIEGYVGIDYVSSSRTSRIVTDTQITSEEIFSSREIDLSGSTLQIWVDIENKGNDILVSPLKEITLNFYMGNDELPFYTKTIENELTNLKPGEKITLTFTDIPLDFRLLQRLMAGETIEVRVPHYSFGDDQIYLESARASCIEIDVVNETSSKTYFAVPRKEYYSFTEALDLMNISYTYENGKLLEVNNMRIHTGELPYKWFKILITKRDGSEVKFKELNDIKLTKGDRVFIKHFTDKDGDLLSDEDELKLGTDPNKQDSDGDGLIDGYDIPEKGIYGELSHNSNPIIKDTDKDGFNDFVEVIGDGDPTNATDYPKYPMIFEHSKYRGEYKLLKESSKTLKEFKNKVSSIYVPKGKILTLYRSENYKDWIANIITPVSKLGAYNDKVRSIKVRNLDKVSLLIKTNGMCLKKEGRVSSFFFGGERKSLIMGKCNEKEDLWEFRPKQDGFEIADKSDPSRCLSASGDNLLIQKCKNSKVYWKFEWNDDELAYLIETNTGKRLVRLVNGALLASKDSSGTEFLLYFQETYWKLGIR